MLGSAADYYFLAAADHAGYFLFRNVRSFKKFEPEQEVKDADDWFIPVEKGAEDSEEAEKAELQEKDETAEEGSAEE